MTAEFSFASFLPCVLYSGAAPCGSLATLFSYICDGNGGRACHLLCMHIVPSSISLSVL